LNIAALGAPASLVGVTGDDEAADSLVNSLKGAGVRRCSSASRTSRPSSSCGS
jgi:bifunctional ADP-heptose synthase (sugar kinase/adenylyltransferase)